MNLIYPNCHGANMIEYTPRHPLIRIWRINPGIAINELVFGMRIPNRMVICRSCKGNPADRTRIECPSCGDVHVGRLWAGTTAYGHWAGLICPSCEQRIPCVWNYTSLLLLSITKPLWSFPVKRWQGAYITWDLKRTRKKKAGIESKP